MSDKREDPEPPYKLLVTQSQLSEGYFRREGMIGWHHKFQAITDHGDGTITVVNPEWEWWNLKRLCGSGRSAQVKQREVG